MWGKGEKERGEAPGPRGAGGARRCAGSLRCPELLRARGGPAQLGPRGSEPSEPLCATAAGLCRDRARGSRSGALEGSARAPGPAPFPFPSGLAPVCAPAGSREPRARRGPPGPC